MKLKVREFGNVTFMDTANGAIHVAEGFIDQPDHWLHNAKITRSTFIPNKRTRAKGVLNSVQFVVDEVAKEPPVFTTLDGLMQHYELKPMDDE